MAVVKSVIFLVSFLFGFSVADCPNGFTKHSNSCYKAIRIKTSWAEAELFCSAISAELAAIETPAEETFAVGLLQRLGEAYDPPTFWLAGNDIREDGTWVWGNTDVHVGSTYNDWHTGQPDNHHSDENCMSISRDTNWDWSDNRCDSEYNFLCEKKLQADMSQIFG